MIIRTGLGMELFGVMNPVMFSKWFEGFVEF